ncbi:MAG: radical SAM protein [Myxococcota bacterium]|nr:radical SAM protein [Myxococcota bacterium]
MSRARVFPRDVQRILTPTGGYLSAFTHTLQPYAGCQFSCVYCYVREMTVQRANPYRLPWSHWISPKRNAPERLRREGERGRLRDARIFCASVTDPYTPLERRLRLTRGCLEVMSAHPPAFLVMQTRSPLIERDADLLARLPTAIASLTVTTDDEGVRRLLEPDSPSIGLRIETLARLRRAGVRTQAAVSPLLPGDPGRLARALEPVVERVVVDDFFAGDGAGGRRSRTALERLRAAGHAAWAEPGYAEAALEAFRAVLGAERVGFSAQGFAAGSGALS